MFNFFPVTSGFILSVYAVENVIWTVLHDYFPCIVFNYTINHAECVTVESIVYKCIQYDCCFFVLYIVYMTQFDEF